MFFFCLILLFLEFLKEGKVLNMFKKIVSGIMSAVIAAGILPQLQIVGSAEITSTSGRIAYEGYDDTNANYLEYDESMIPDMSWYDEATGTEDDPYIIDSAEDLLALSYTSQYGLREFSGDIDYSILKLCVNENGKLDESKLLDIECYSKAYDKLSLDKYNELIKPAFSTVADSVRCIVNQLEQC